MTYYCSRCEVEVSIVCNLSSSGQELRIKSLGFVLCTDACLRTDTLKGHYECFSNIDLIAAIWLNTGYC